MAWLKSHIPQLVVVVCSVLVALGLHFGKLTTDQAIGIGAVLGGVGIHLPAIVYSLPGKPPSPPPLPVLVLLVALVTAIACAPKSVAKSEYDLQLKACDDVSDSRAEDDACKAKVRAKWDEAGAPPAAILDGGSQ